MNGGRKLWIDQKRPTTTEVPQLPADQVQGRQGATRRRSAPSATRCWPTRRRASRCSTSAARRSSPARRLHMEDYPQEGSLRGGHIPGAVSVPWGRAVNEDGTFKSADELKAIYEGEVGLKPTDDVVAYCRIGERSSLTWFVLTYLLGYPEGPQLRRLVVRVGQPRPRPDRQGGLSRGRSATGPDRSADADPTRDRPWPPHSKRSSRNCSDADRQERIELLIDFAKSLPPLPDRLAAHQGRRAPGRGVPVAGLPVRRARRGPGRAPRRRPDRGPDGPRASSRSWSRGSTGRRSRRSSRSRTT